MDVVGIEGPENAVYYRGEGRLDGRRARVELPRYFERLVRPEGRTVQVTAVADAGRTVSALAATPVVDGAFEVQALDGRVTGQRFWWEVKGARADVEPLDAEPAREQRAAERPSPPAGPEAA